MTTQRGRITFSGVLDEADRLAFSDFDIQTVGGNTVLIGEPFLAPEPPASGTPARTEQRT